MVQLSLYQALTIYAWFPLAFTLAVLLLIARFYERFSSANTHWRLYALPIFGYAGAHVREAAVAMADDPLADLLHAASGILLLILTIRLSALMLRHREAAASISPLLLAGGAFGPAGLTVALLMLGRFTRRMVRLNRQPPYYHAFYLAAVGMAAATVLRLLSFEPGSAWGLAYPAMVAASMTTGAVASWRSWSWLLAERA